MDLSKRLAELLGRDYLQRYLLRRAETAIISDANQTLNRLSSGTLRMEERQDSEGTKALDVDVHDDEKGGGPFGLSFLSGSQKFRVAVSLALGIGRYASQEGQRVQSVIIDEGFGSLDKEGQDDMVRELHNLSSVLEKVIIVSHQEQFRDGFENRYDISVSPDDRGSRVVRFVG